MEYTIKKLAQLSGVSIRTLHWYDEVGLLKPAYCGTNGYRYYQEEQLLLLQQILFFREIGLSLKEIIQVITQDDFDKIKTLQAHKQVLENSLNKKLVLIKTIDKTLLHLQGKYIIKNEELYHGFDSERQEEYEKYLVHGQGSASEALIFESKKRTAKWGKDEWDPVKNEGDAIHKALAKCIDKGLTPESNEVQEIMKRHCQMINRFYEVSKDVYVGLSQLYVEHPDFKKFFDVYHKDMIPFIGKAMRFYADKYLK